MDDHYPEFEEIAHTADLEIIAYGKSLPELFVNAGKGMYAVSGAQPGEESGESRKILINAIDYETMLVSYLEELIFLAEQLLMSINPVLNISLTELSGELPLYSLNKIKIEIKAVTYYEMEIIKETGVYRTKITFDI